jgi:hypothetical protein
VCVVADRFAATAAEWNGEEALALIRNVAAIVGAAPFVFAGHSQSQLLETVARETPIAPSRLLGSAPEAMASAIVAIVAMEARCSPGEVQLAVIGVPPSGFVVPWSEVSVGGYAIDRVLSQVQLSAIQARSARLWPPGPYALGAAAARVVGAMLDSSRRAFSVMTPLRGEFGVRQRAAALPCRLGAGGVEHIRVPSLSARERVQFETALGV